jgi:hypothetical protein
VQALGLGEDPTPWRFIGKAVKSCNSSHVIAPTKKIQP